MGQEKLPLPLQYFLTHRIPVTIIDSYVRLEITALEKNIALKFVTFKPVAYFHAVHFAGKFQIELQKSISEENRTFSTL